MESKNIALEVPGMAFLLQHLAILLQSLWKFYLFKLHDNNYCLCR